MNMNRSQKIVEIVRILQKRFPVSWRLSESNPYKVLISCILSQRTKDENTARASKRLFSKYKTPKQIANVNLKELEHLIKPSGFYKVKAKRIKKISKILTEKYKGKVPKTHEELLKLPGVGRKTAGITMVYGFGKPVCIPVDTHLHRVPNRIGLIKTKTPEKTELELMKITPRRYWIPLNELFVRFGQETCKPVKPLCYECEIEKYCKYEKKDLIKPKQK